MNESSELFLETVTIRGELIEAGNDESGQPRIVIKTTVEELRGKKLPFYKDALIGITWRQ